MVSDEDRNLMSTSAQLRQVQQDLAASQADVTRAERERDEAQHDLAHAAFEIDKLKARLAAPCGTCHPCDHYGVHAELASALVEMDHLRAELREAYALLPNRDENRG